jgi:hypothetical protein
MLSDMVVSCGGSLSGEDDGVLVATVPGALQAVLTATRMQCLVAGFARYSGSNIKGIAIGISASGVPATRKKGADPSGRSAFRNQALPGRVLVLGTIRRQLEGLPGISLRKLDEGTTGSRGSIGGASLGAGTETAEILIPDLRALADSLIPVSAGAIAPLPAFDNRPGGAPSKSGETGVRAAHGQLSGVANGFGDSTGKAWSSVMENGAGFWAKAKDAVLAGLERLPEPIRKQAKWIAVGAAVVAGVGLALALKPVIFQAKPPVVATNQKPSIVATNLPNSAPANSTEPAAAGSGTTGVSSTATSTPAGPAAPPETETSKSGDKNPPVDKTKKKDDPKKTPPGNGKTNKPGGDQPSTKTDPQGGSTVIPEPPPTKHGGLVVTLAPDLIDDLLKKADDANNKGDYDQAIRYCNRVLAGDPRNSRAQSIRAQAQERKSTSR